LCRAYLMDAVLAGADLYGANCAWADLRRANLQNAKLFYTSLRGANLRYSNLDQAYVCEVDWENAALDKAQMNEIRRCDPKQF
jgi:uncharacterized protein YjbI with pentapeptide repeats